MDQTFKTPQVNDVSHYKLPIIGNLSFLCEHQCGVVGA